jgi:hypothetical protein
MNDLPKVWRSRRRLLRWLAFKPLAQPSLWIKLCTCGYTGSVPRGFRYRNYLAGTDDTEGLGNSNCPDIVNFCSLTISRNAIEWRRPQHGGILILPGCGVEHIAISPSICRVWAPDFLGRRLPIHRGVCEASRPEVRHSLCADTPPGMRDGNNASSHGASQCPGTVEHVELPHAN